MLGHLEVLVEPLNTVIQTSADRLDTSASTLFAQLSVFADGFTLVDAQTICGGPRPGADILPSLKVLLDASLVLVRTVNDSYRYFILEPVREHAIRRLSQAGEQSHVWREHAVYFRKLVESAEPDLEGPDQQNWVSRLLPEDDNIRAVLERSAAGAVDIEEGLRLASAHAPLWYIRGQFGEGRRWLQRLLTASGICRAPIRAKALNWEGMLAYHQSDFEEARQLLEEGLSLFDQLPDDEATTTLLNELGFVSKAEGRAKSLNSLGFVAKELGEYEKSVQQYEESLRLYRALDDEWGIVWTATDLALALLYIDDSAGAVKLLEEAAERQRHRPVRGRTGAALTTIYLGYATLARGDTASAVKFADEALRACRELGYKRGVVLAAHFAGLISYINDDLATARSLLRESLKLCNEMGDLEGTAECLEGLAAIATRDRDDLAGARLLGAADRIYAQLKGRRLHAEYGVLESKIHKALAPLRTPAFAEARREGEAMSLEEAAQSGVRKSSVPELT
jgi:tetratricopeptide (TPR) repeat protein